MNLFAFILDFLDRSVVTPPSPVRLMEPAGSEVRLRCCSKGRQGFSHQEHCKSHDVVWHYKVNGVTHKSSCSHPHSVLTLGSMEIIEIIFKISIPTHGSTRDFSGEGATRKFS